MINIDKIINDKRFRGMVKESWKISWPMAFIMFYEFMIGITDVYVAGKFGNEAQAAYGFAFQLYFVFIIIGIALSVGAVSIVSRLFTSDNKKDLSIAVNSSIILASISGLALAIIGIFFSSAFVSMLNLPSEVKWLTVPFLMIYSIAFPFDYILMNANGILRSCDMIKKSLWIMSIVCFMNIILDFYLAFWTPLGLNGIALATVISIFTGAVLSMGCINRLISGIKFSFSVAKNILKISWPSGLLQVFWQLASLVLFLILSLLPRNNVEIMAALTNGLKIESAIFLPVFAFSLANAVIVGNLLGKKEEASAFHAGIITALMGVVVAGIMTLIIMFNAGNIALLLSNNQLVVNESMKYIYIALLFEPVMAWGVILGGGLNGAGDTMGVMVITSLSVWLVRIPLCYFLSIYFGLGAVAVWWAMNASILIQAIFITKRYFARSWITQGQNAAIA